MSGISLRSPEPGEASQAARSSEQPNAASLQHIPVPGLGGRCLAWRSRGWGAPWGREGIRPFPDALLLPRSAARIPALRSAGGHGVKESGHRDRKGAVTVREELRSSESVLGGQ